MQPALNAVKTDYQDTVTLLANQVIQHFGRETAFAWPPGVEEFAKQLTGNCVSSLLVDS